MSRKPWPISRGFRLVAGHILKDGPPKSWKLGKDHILTIFSSSLPLPCQLWETEEEPAEALLDFAERHPKAARHLCHIFAWPPNPSRYAKSSKPEFGALTRAESCTVMGLHLEKYCALMDRDADLNAHNAPQDFILTALAILPFKGQD